MYSSMLKNLLFSKWIAISSAYPFHLQTLNQSLTNRDTRDEGRNKTRNLATHELIVFTQSHAFQLFFNNRLICYFLVRTFSSF